MTKVGPKEAHLRALRSKTLASDRAPKAVRLAEAVKLAQQAEIAAAPSAEAVKRRKSGVGRDGVVQEIEDTLAEVMAEISNPSQAKKTASSRRAKKKGKGKKPTGLGPGNHAAKGRPMDPSKPRFDKNEYQKQLMKKRRADAKAKRDQEKLTKQEGAE